MTRCFHGGAPPACWVMAASAWLLLPSGAWAQVTPAATQVDAMQDAAQPVTPTSSPASVLMDQANYWRQKGRDDLALAALRRAVLLDPDNADALSQSAQLQAELGHQAAAQADLAQLRKIRPADPRIQSVEQALRVGQIDTDAVADARSLAAGGHAVDAVARYRALFHGGPPPDALAVEYYQVLAGTEDGWDAARAGLAQSVTRQPKDMRGQLAYATLLTYRPSSRLDGISRLAILASNPATAENARTAWRQALEWLPIDGASIPLYQAFLTRYPNDQGLTQRLADAQNPRKTTADEAGADRQRGFDALQANRLRDAEASFQAALTINPQDSDALGGLGLVRQRQGRIADARGLLERAIAAAPDKAGQWQPALNGATVASELASARALARAGQLAPAAQQLRDIISRGGNTTEAEAMLADLQARGGDLAGAEASYRSVLARQPDNPTALVGLAGVLNRRGRNSEAETLLARAAATGHGQSAGQAQAQQLRQQAEQMTDLDARIGLLREAVAAAPSDPWARLDLARALAKQGHPAEGQAIMAALTDGGRPTSDDLHATALFALEQNRPAEAAAFAERIPAGSRSPDMTRLLASARFQQEVRRVVADASFSGNARQNLLALAAAPDPDGSRGAAIVGAFASLGDPSGARQAIAVELAVNKNPTVAVRMAYAGALLAAGLADDAGRLAASADMQGGLTGEQRVQIAELRDGIAVRESDKLNQAGRTAEAYDQLAPALRQSPTDPDLNLALARLYQTARDPKQSLAIAQALLRRDPGNLDARRTAVSAAIEIGDLQEAGRLVQSARTSNPDDPRVWLMSADLARARGDNGGALQDLLMAQTLRHQQISPDQSGSPTGAVVPLAQSGGSVAGENPFRGGAAPPPAMHVASTGDMISTMPIGPVLSSDPMSNDIAQAIAAAQADVAPVVRVAPTYRTRSGSSGLDQLNEIKVPLEASFSPGGYGRLTVGATPTLLSNGSLSGATAAQQQFGTLVFGGAQPGNQHAQGVGVSAAYKYQWLAADVGSTPIGFLTENVMGGVELSPELAPGLRLRATAERRPVTDSLLSYAGTVDTGTGATFGGVMRNRAHTQFELSIGLANFYAGGGYNQLTGENVKTNTESEFGAGGSYPVYRSGNNELTLGVDLVYFSYANNLRYFTLGQGGYFSPQSYFAAVIPVNFTQRLPNLTWSVGGSIGAQSYTENSSLVFPNNPDLQSRLVNLAATNSSIVASYPGKSQSGILGGVHASIEYEASPSLRIGGLLRYDKAGDWTETTGTVFGRYIFNSSP